MDAPTAAYLKAFPLPVHPLGPALMRYSFSRVLVPWLRENAVRHDIVVCNGLWGYSGLGVWLALHRATTPYVVVAHGMLDPWFKQTYPLKHLKKWLYWFWGEYRVLRDARAVIFTCEEERLLARRSFWLYAANERVVSYGTAGPRGDAETQRRLFFSSFPNTTGKRLVLSMGRIHPKKGCDLSIMAFARVMASDPNWHLVIAGPDQEGWQPRLAALAAKIGIADRITWTGMVSEEVKWGAFRASDVFLLPSHQENFGIVVAEALACSMPVLISDRVNIWREVETARVGFVAKDDTEGTAVLLRQWLDLSEGDRALMRIRAKEYFDAKFEISKTAVSFLGVLDSVVRSTMESNALA